MKKSSSQKSGTEKQTDVDVFVESSPLEKFFTAQLKDMYYAERRIGEHLEEMASSSNSEELEDAISNHRKETERHVKRLEKVFRAIGVEPEEKNCEAIEGLIKEAIEIRDMTKEGTSTRDAALIIALQKIEHYEIASYGGLLELALTMDLHQAASLLDKTLREEVEADTELTEIAESYINVRAEQEGPYSWEKEA